MEQRQFYFPRADEERGRLDQLQELIAFTMLGNTQREMLRNLAEPGEPIDTISRGLLAFSEEARYALGRLDLEDPIQLERGKQLSREIKQIEWTISFLERMLTPIPVQTDGEA